MTLATWRIPENQSTRDEQAGQLRGILAMGIDPTANVFDLPEIAGQTAQLVGGQTAQVLGTAYRAEQGIRVGRHGGKFTW